MLKNTLLAAVAVVAFAAPGFADDKTKVHTEATVESNAQGDLKREVNQERKDASGKVSTDVKAKVDVDDNGNFEKTTSTKEVTDPKGLFNKDTVKTKTTVKSEDGKVTTESKKTVNGETVEETSH